MKKIVFLILLTSICIQINAQEIPNKEVQKGYGKIDFLSISMPNNDPNMGFSGTHYNLSINDWSYAGIGIYGALTGNRGGFFTLGINAGLKHHIAKNLFTDIGFHFGGGGGAAAPDGGGAFILPHANLSYQFEDFTISSGWSYVNFFDGGLIRGHQLNFALEIPLNFNYSSYSNRQKKFDIASLRNTNWNERSKRTSILLHQNNLKINAVEQGINDGRTIRLAGFEFATFLTKNWFGFLKVDGAFAGIKAGYMDVFLGGGYKYSFNRNRTNILTKFAIGGGGGGGIDSKGGLLFYPELSLEQRISNSYYVSVNTGIVSSFDRHFFTNAYGIGLKYYFDRGGTISETREYTSSRLKGIQIIPKQEIYFNAQRDTGVSLDMQQISLQINLDLTKNLFLAGETSFANFGDAGAYAEGIVGAGIQSNPILNNKITLFIQALAGAAGGGGISTGEGFIVKPSTGVNVKLTDKLNLRSAYGWVKAKGGALNTSFLNFGISYNFSFLKLK